MSMKSLYILADIIGSGNYLAIKFRKHTYYLGYGANEIKAAHPNYYFLKLWARKKKQN